MTADYQHAIWSSRLVYLMASIGAAVGLGNIWKFPYMLGANGGAAFVAVYLLAVVFVATPLMMAEMVIGRRGRMSPPQTLRRLAVRAGASPRWSLLGWLGLLGIFLALSFFCVVAGWSLAYALMTAGGAFAGLAPAGVGALFEAFLARPLPMIGWQALFMALTVAVVMRGVNAGVEKAINLLMPGLFAMLAGLTLYAGVAGDFGAAVDYLFRPDFSAVTPSVALAAIGQAFFSVNVGIGAVLVYAAYLPNDVNLPRSALIIAGGDTLVAVLAGLVIFPMVFAFGFDPAEGPGLIFVTLSAVFARMPGGELAGTVFFLLIAVAALTTTLAMLEVLVSRAEESARWSRATAAPLIGAAAFVLGLATVFSFNLWSAFHPLAWIPGLETATPFNLIDYSVSNIILPLGGMLYAVFAGWRLARADSRAQLRLTTGWFRLWLWLVRVVAPAAILLVFIGNLL